MKLGVALGRLNPRYFTGVAEAADRLGYESVWLPEHLVLPLQMTNSPFPGQEHPPVPPTTPVFDSLGYLCFLAGRTRRVRLGTHIYNLALRHPFVAARAVQTLDLVSGGRAEIGIGAGWLAEEWEAAQLDFSSRGARLDEAVEVCKRLWREEVIEHRGKFFEFGPVRFDPKPLQQPWPALHVGGESDAALRRAARLGDGWLGMGHTLDSIAGRLERLRDLREANGRLSERFEVTVGAEVREPEELARWEASGVHRLIVSPWARSAEAVAGLEAMAEAMSL